MTAVTRRSDWHHAVAGVRRLSASGDGALQIWISLSAPRSLSDAGLQLFELLLLFGCELRSDITFQL
jgi:hypothetical protein